MYKQNGKRFDSTHSSHSRPSGQGGFHDTSNAFIIFNATIKLLRRAPLHRHLPANRWRRARRVHAAPEDEDARVQTKEKNS